MPENSNNAWRYSRGGLHRDVSEGVFKLIVLDVINENKSDKIILSFDNNNGSVVISHRYKKEDLNELMDIFYDTSNNSKAIKYINHYISNNFDIDNLSETYGMNLLHQAIEDENEEIANALLQLGADPTIKNSRGMTARDRLEEINNHKSS